MIHEYADYTKYDVYEHAYPVNNYSSAKQLLDVDRRIERSIKDAHELIEGLQEYRKALAKRMQELATMASHTRCKLERHPKRWNDDIITYTITTETIYEDGTAERLSCEKYLGKQRREAIAEFERLKKASPHWEFEKDIEKKHWER